MRTFGKNDFKDFDFVRDDQIGNTPHPLIHLIIGKFYSVTDVETDENR